MSSKKEKISQGTLIVLSAPSGCGKTSIVERLLNRHPQWVRSISATTRPPRMGEKDKEDYFFFSKQEFEKMKKEGKLLEWAPIYGQEYGTPKQFILDRIAEGKNVLLTIDVQGAQQVMKAWPVQGALLSIFILPPSIKALRERLTGRNTETPEEIEKRIEVAQDEIKFATLYGHTVINQNLDQAVIDIENIILKSTTKRKDR